MQIFLSAPVRNTSGKTFGQKNKISTRTVNGQTFSYHWPEDYNYPVVFNRAKQNLLLRMAQKEANRIYSSPEELEKMKKAFAAEPGKYHALKGFIFGFCHARAKEQISDELVHAEMQRQLSSTSHK